ncbi:MAG: hypothetical protein HDS58_01070 [Barnesiella sp.]|nr:hypothetical protein [Barnesiella sp.]MBD5248667.1 hypothetical protein [Barnesiella sp.]
MKPYISIIFTTLLLASCSLLEEPVEECPTSREPEEIKISFRMLTPASDVTSRADDQGHEEVESEYRRFEDGIDLHDLGMFVFAKMANSTENEKLLLKVVDLGRAQDVNDHMQIIGTPGSYTVNLTFKKEEFDNFIGQELTTEGTENIQFRLLLVANSSTAGTTGGLNSAKWSAVRGQDYPTVISQMNDWTYTMAYLCNFNLEYAEHVMEPGKSVTDFYPNTRQCMPMFGTTTALVSQRSLCNSSDVSRAYLGDMYMLRSLAKIRLIDNIANKNADGYPKVISVDVVGTQHDIHVLPYDAVNYINGNQVHTPYLANPEYETGNLNKFTYSLGIIPPSWTDVPTQNRKGDVFVGYLPEMSILSLPGQTEEGLPAYRINVALSKSADGTELTRDYVVPMNQYQDNVFDFGDYILRNHIYTLSINRVNLEELTFNVAVNEWRTIDYEYEY